MIKGREIAIPTDILAVWEPKTSRIIKYVDIEALNCEIVGRVPNGFPRCQLNVIKYCENSTYHIRWVYFTLGMKDQTFE